MLLKNFSEFIYEAGIDEAGRGCLAGPLTAAAVILKKDCNIIDIDDSKKLSPKKRLELKRIIEENALAYSVAFVNSSEIDKINVLNSTYKAMHNAIRALSLEPDFILVDGNRFKPYGNIPFNCVIKGDQKYQNIAAASILAKTYRDDYMESLHSKFPIYKWRENKGYGTKYHINMILKYGRCIYHRYTFKIKSKQLNFQFN